MEFNLADLIRDGARRSPDADCLTFESISLSWAEMDHRSSRVANALTSSGVTAGGRVAVIARNSPLFFELLFGCAKIGAILVPLNWRLSAREIYSVLDDAEPLMVITGEEQAALLPTAGPFARLESNFAYSKWRDAAGDVDPRAVTGGDATLALLYTSGTTGRAKGVRISHANLSYSARMARELWGFTAKSVNLVAMPMFHVGGLGYGLMSLSQGGHTVLLQQPSPAPVLEAIARHRVTHAFFVPTVIQSLLDAPNVAALNLRSLERIVYGASPISGSLLERALRVFGCGFNHAYGMTETAGTVVTLQPEEHDASGPNQHRLQSCGRAVPWVELSVRNPTTGVPVESGEVGEIWIRSPMNTAGYWRNPAATAAVIRPDGWLKTGDAAAQDADGFLYIRDRYKDMIVSGGENVFPAEVENVLAEHPDLSEVAVVGAPHPRWGETVRAVVVAKSGRTPRPNEVMAFCRARLAHYKCPTLVEIVDALPKSASGKILRRELRDGVVSR